VLDLPSGRKWPIWRDAKAVGLLPFVFDLLKSNPLDNIPRTRPQPAIVNLRGPRVGVPGEVLHVLIEGIGHNRNPEAVRGVAGRRSCNLAGVSKRWLRDGAGSLIL